MLLVASSHNAIYGKCLVGALLAGFWVLHSQPVQAQQRQSGSLSRGTELLLRGVEHQPDTIYIKYTIPCEGYVEVRLYDQQQRRVALTTVVRTVGEHRVSVIRERLRANGQYTFTIIFKGKQYHGSFFN